MDTPNKIEVEVRPRDVFKHYVHIQRPGDILQWSFYTRKKNIGFGLFYLYLSSQHPANNTPSASASATASASSTNLGSKSANSINNDDVRCV